MKCPKCAYNSFESNDTCPKCTASLLEIRQLHGLDPVVLPASLRKTMAVSLASSDQSNRDAEGKENNDMFEFDISSPQKTTEQDIPAAPLSFVKSPTAAANADPFAELLESAPQPVKADVDKTESAPSGLELNSFSWDDTPSEKETGTESGKDSRSGQEDDDFASLFGDLNDTKK